MSNDPTVIDRVLDPETIAGMAKLDALGLGHLGDVQVSFGGVCTGGLAQMFGKAKHEEYTAKMLGMAEKALQYGHGEEGAEKALLAPIAFFIERDENTGGYTRINSAGMVATPENQIANAFTKDAPERTAESVVPKKKATI